MARIDLEDRGIEDLLLLYGVDIYPDSSAISSARHTVAEVDSRCTPRG